MASNAAPLPVVLSCVSGRSVRFGKAAHLPLHLRIHIDRRDHDLRVTPREHSEYLVDKGSAHHIDAREVQYDIAEALDAIHDPLGLGAGDELLSCVQCQGP